MSTKRLVYIAPSGELYRLADGGIVNIGGTEGPTFFVDGKALLFSDGTPTDGSAGTVLTTTFQEVYDSSVPATIDLTAGNHFILNSLNSKQFIFNADTGKVTVTGDLEVLGDSAIIEGTISNLDQLNIAPPLATTTALNIEPRPGVTLTTDLVRFRLSNAGPSVFVIDQTGTTTIQSLIVTGTINGVDIVQLDTDFAAHISATPGARHKASQISVDGPFTSISGSDVEQVLHSIDSVITTVGASTVTSYEHFESVGALIWNVAHNKNSLNPTVTIFDVSGEEIWPDRVEVVDNNNLNVHFTSVQIGRAAILLF